MNVARILMMSAKRLRWALLKENYFEIEVMTSLTKFYHVSQILLYVWTCDKFRKSCMSMREVIITSIL